MDVSRTMADAGLHDWMAAEMEIADWQPAATEKALQEVLGAVEGVRILGFFDGKVALEYDPTQHAISDLCTALEQHGLHGTPVLSGPASPVSDALHPED